MKARLFIWGLVTIAIGLIVYQNQDFYFSEHRLSLNLFTEFEIPPLANVIHALLYFLAGLLLASISLYHERFKLRRQIKKLDTAFNSCAIEVAEIKSAECPQPQEKRPNFFKRFRRKISESKPVPASVDVTVATD